MASAAGGSQRALEEQARAASQQYPRTLDRDQFLALAVSFADLSIQCIRNASTAAEKSHLKLACSSLLDEAERAKRATAWDPVPSDRLLQLILGQRADAVPVSTRSLPTAEQILLWRGSKLNGNTFPPWQSDPDSSEFERDGDGDLFLDPSNLPLSSEQTQMLDGWKRPEEAIPPPNWAAVFPSSPVSEHAPSFETHGYAREPDLVQDASPDCSVVASLAAGLARGQRGHSKLLAATMWPYDYSTDCPTSSPNGKHVMRLNFNGCFRKVVIDDRLPVSKASRMLHVVDRNNPTLIWPALLEKAYLKVRGGYDFPGSNSGTDIWVLLGWIPEQIFLQHEDTDENLLWKRLKEAHTAGNVLVTLGTAAIEHHIELETGLAGDHDYAVLDLIERGGQRLLLVKNPWLKSTTWRGQVNLYEEDGTLSPTSDKELAPPGHGSFWIPFTTVMVNFQTLYLNWNPATFNHRQDFHFTWDLSVSRSPLRSFINNHQYTVTSAVKQTVWLLLSRHFANRPPDGNPITAEDSAFIALYAFAGQSARVYTSANATSHTLFFDAPQTLLQLDLPANVPYTIVAEEENLPAGQHAFSLFAFSADSLLISPAPLPRHNRVKVDGEWTTATAGGPASSATFSTNPQYSLHLPRPSRVTLFLQSVASDPLPIQVNLAHSGGTRIYALPRRVIAASSGNYAFGCTTASTADTLPAGTYTITCSTHEAGQTGPFELYIDTDIDGTGVRPLPREGAGRLRMRSNATLAEGNTKLRAPLHIQRLCRAWFVGATRALATGRPDSSGIRLGVERGSGPNVEVIAESEGGEFSDGSIGGARTGDVDLRTEDAARPGLWLAVERVGYSQAEEVDIVGWCDSEGLALGQWSVVD